MCKLFSALSLHSDVPHMGHVAIELSDLVLSVTVSTKFEGLDQKDSFFCDFECSKLTAGSFRFIVAVDYL
jgi:hypothetical protein